MFTHHVALLICLVFAFFSTVSAYAGPGPCSGQCGNAHDPAIMKRGETYYRFSTGGKIAIHTAPNLNGPWTFKGPALPKGSKIALKGSNDLWAPDVAKVGNLYYLLYSVSSFGSQDSAIGVASSTTMDAVSWTDHGATGVQSKKGGPYNAIDGNLIAAGSQSFMSFGSFWQDLWITPVSIANGTVKKTGKETQIAYQPAGGHEMEAPFVFNNGGKWWLFFSAGKCCALDKNRPAKGAEYRVLACLSKGGPAGPYADKSGKSCTQGGGTMVLPSHDNIYAPGGQGVYNDPTHGPVLYYHYVNTKIGYQDGQKKFGWNKINFAGGWPTV